MEKFELQSTDKMQNLDIYLPVSLMTPEVKILQLPQLHL